jgi:hypothetical protein
MAENKSAFEQVSQVSQAVDQIAFHSGILALSAAIEVAQAENAGSHEQAWGTATNAETPATQEWNAQSERMQEIAARLFVMAGGAARAIRTGIPARN